MAPHTGPAHSTLVLVEGGHAVCIGDPDRFTAKLLEACPVNHTG